MKTILLINDQSPEAEHAVGIVLVLAQNLQANIILANTVVPKKDEPDFGWIEGMYDETIAEPVHSQMMRKLRCRKKLHTGFFPEIQEVELSDDRESIFFLAARNDIYMVVKAMNEFLPHALLNVNLSINSLINKLQVPLLLVPSSWTENGFKRLVYLTDLRFCCIQTGRFLAELAGKWTASLVIAHTSVSGLPKIEIEEAKNIFSEAVCPNINYGYLLLNMLDRKDQENTLEVIVGQMKADLLVLVNQHFHFNTIIKQYFRDNCARYKPAPLLIFPS